MGSPPSESWGRPASTSGLGCALAGKLSEGKEGRYAAGPQLLRVPPQDCTYGTEIISRWKSLLENDQLLSHGGQDLCSDAFHRYSAQGGRSPPAVLWGPGKGCCHQGCGDGGGGDVLIRPRPHVALLWAAQFSFVSSPYTPGIW